MELIERILTENACYLVGETILPRGVMVHSTGANNPYLKRYVQPDDGRLGYNRNGNHWNRPEADTCVHAFIGKLADGTVAVAQTLPWDWRAWHAGRGMSGRSANDTHIAFEICEDDLKDGAYFAAVYRAAVELTAMLCEKFGLDPMEGGVVVGHSEGYTRGMASNHGDVAHWFSRFGKTMEDFRRDVATEMEETMTQEQFKERIGTWLTDLAEEEPSSWSEEARVWAEQNGLITGDENGEKQYKSFCTREQLITFLYRFSRMDL